MVALSTDQVNARSNKIAELSSHSAMGVSRPNCGLVNFSRYVSKNLQLCKLSNDGTKLSTRAQANFCREELAKALRKGPFKVNVILGGYDEKTMGSLVEAKYGAQGYASTFCLSIMDRNRDGEWTRAGRWCSLHSGAEDEMFDQSVQFYY